ncbi:hypothetical protein I552_2676 [Mycobacterium xenopi 3993]|nr:hypothetical protein I552_2676 [Mycobacterium xenopi 3993]
MTLIERLDEATPRLRVNRNVAWVELRNRVTAATRPAQLDGAEDPVDAVMCAYIALYWYHRPEDVTIYGDVATGYIVTPALPSAVGTPSAKPHEPDDVARRLARLAALLEDAQQVRSSSAAAFASTRRALIRRFPLPCGPSNGDRGCSKGAKTSMISSSVARAAARGSWQSSTSAQITAPSTAQIIVETRPIRTERPDRATASAIASARCRRIRRWMSRNAGRRAQAM